MTSSKFAHDLKNHLGVILGFVELLIADAEDARTREDLLEIQKAARHALALVSDSSERGSEVQMAGRSVDPGA